MYSLSNTKQNLPKSLSTSLSPMRFSLIYSLLLAVLSAFPLLAFGAPSEGVSREDMLGSWQNLSVSCSSGRILAWPQFTAVLKEDGSYLAVNTDYPNENPNCQMIESSTFTVNPNGTMTIAESRFDANSWCSFPSTYQPGSRSFPLQLSSDKKTWTVNGSYDPRACPEGGYLIWILQKL